jgi:copper chaperone CopZ
MDEIVKRRTLRLSKNSSECGETNIGDQLSAMDGVKSVTLDRGVVSLEYDLRKVQLSDIEDAIEQSGFTLANTLLARLKRVAVRTMEQNELDNITQRLSPCCSNPREIVEATKKRDS